LFETAPDLWNLGLALAIGFLIGLERGFVFREAGEGQRFAGIRSFTLVALMGGLAALTLDPAGPWLAAMFLGGVIVLVALSQIQLAQSKGVLATTTSIAMLLTFALGFLAVIGETQVASVGAVVTAVILALRDRLHGWLRKLAVVELQAVLQLLLISVVLLPFLPNIGMGPGDVLNPTEIWWMAILVAGLSFLGYVAVKLAGPNAGLLLTGLFGGLASSTAVTVTVSRMAEKGRSFLSVLAAAAALAALLMFIRILILATAVHQEMLPHLLPSIGLMGLVTALGAGVLIFRIQIKKGPQNPDQSGLLRNPLELPTAVGFAALLAVIILLAHFLEQWAGAQGLYVLAAISGLSDVDAITLAMSRVARDGGDIETAANAIVIAALVNTAVKIGIAAVFSGGALVGRLGLVLGPVLAAGLAAFFFL
jgi:uncharacterized membrane protein (DUF4010 family)